MSEYPITSPRGQVMLASLPRFYETFREIRYLAQTEGVESDTLMQSIDDTLNQFFVGTSTWALDDWEKELGLSPAQNQPDQERRDRITSRLRGSGTATISIVKQVAESYDKGSIDIIEDHAAYTVTIRFVDTFGVPPNLDDLKAAVRAVLPAHLELVYEFNYFLWSDLDAQNWTWDQLDALNLTWDQIETYG